MTSLVKTHDGKTQKEICSLFNKSLKSLAKKLYIISKKNIKVSSLMNQLKIATEESPILLIEEAGPGIYEQRELIKNREDDFFSKVDFNEKYGHTDAMKANIDLFNMVKDRWSTIGHDEKAKIGVIMDTLLDCYIKYTIFEKIKCGKIKPETAGFIVE